jgi:hypothetical protein
MNVNANYLHVSTDYTASTHTIGNIELAVTHSHEDQQFYVWTMVNDPGLSRDPTRRAESFIVGAGDTILDAMVDAKVELARALSEVDAMIRTLQPPSRAERVASWFKGVIQ